MQRYEMQVTLQLPITNDMLPSSHEVYDAGSAIHAARKAAEGIADSAEAKIIVVHVLEYHNDDEPETPTFYEVR